MSICVPFARFGVNVKGVNNALDNERKITSFQNIMRSKNSRLSIIIPSFNEQVDQWCLQGCGQQCQAGSKFCSQNCFRQALLNQDVECVNELLSFNSRSASPCYVSGFSSSGTGSPTINSPTFPHQASLSCALALFPCSSATENLFSVYECLKLANKPNKQRRSGHSGIKSFLL